MMGAILAQNGIALDLPKGWTLVLRPYMVALTD